GTADTGEQCDDGDTVTTDGCIITMPGGAVGTRNCARARCVDVYLCSGADCSSGLNGGVEECDDGNATAGDGCTSCALDFCGDGSLDVGERGDRGQAFCTGGMNGGTPCRRATDCIGDGVCDGGATPGAPGCP